MNSRSAKGGRRGGHGSNKLVLLLAVGIVAFFWAGRPCKGQIEVDAYISNLGSNDVSVINTSSATVVRTIAWLQSLAPIGVAVTPDGRFAYITNGGGPTGSNTVSVLDVATNTVVATIPVGNSPAGVAVTPDAQVCLRFES